MWYAALSGSAAVFVNHPGASCEEGDMRPGYWHGNGQMPAVKQQHAMIGSIYCISQEHPIHYTHLYCPACRFSQLKQDGNWMFLQQESGYLAIWCSQAIEAYQGMNYHCEYRAYGDQMAWFVYAGGVTEFESMRAFIDAAKTLKPRYDRKKNQLTAQNFILTYEACKDETQYL